MADINDYVLFAEVVGHGGFAAASRAPRTPQSHGSPGGAPLGGPRRPPPREPRAAHPQVDGQPADRRAGGTAWRAPDRAVDAPFSGDGSGSGVLRALPDHHARRG